MSAAFLRLHCLGRAPSITKQRSFVPGSVMQRNVRRAARLATSAAAGMSSVAAETLPQEARSRAKAAVLGALLADAATTPLHWIYDTKKVQALLESKGKLAEPEFYPDPSCPFYTYPVGTLSPYGDEAYAMLQYAATHADIDGPGLTQHLYSHFKQYTGRLNGTSKALIKAWEEGSRFPAAAADDSQAHAIVKVPVIVARYGGTPQLLEKVEEAVRSQQNNALAVSMGQAAARILERVVVEGSTVSEAVSWALQPGNLAPEVHTELAKYLTDQSPSFNEMVWEVTKAPACGLPGAFINALYCAATSHSYIECVRRNIVASGDNCSRVLYAGALWAAAEGEAALPDAWKQEVPLFPELDQLADQLLSRRAA